MNKITAKESEVIPDDFTNKYTFPELGASKRPRHIFIFLDGTWNEERSARGEATPTNVLRMYQELIHQTSHDIESSTEKTDTTEFIAYYYRGVGSRQDNGPVNHMWFGFNGKDEERIRNAAFADIYRNYNSADNKIYILGFSRGAASARLLARDICIKGMPPHIRVHTTHFPNLLTGQIEARVERVERLKKNDEIEQLNKYWDNDNFKPKIAFLGCWDTVDAFVLPSRYPKQGMLNKILDKTVRASKSILPRRFGKQRFSGDENLIPDEVRKAVHCVAMDETRDAFLPTLMPHAPNIEEVWFPGVHSDVGGGYEDNLLAEAPYKFMKNRLLDAFGGRNYELFECISDKEKQSGYCFHFHGLNTGLKNVKGVFGFGTSMRKIRVLDAKNEMPNIHDSVDKIMTSGSAFAANAKNTRTWAIIYDPYNYRELNNQYNDVSD